MRYLADISPSTLVFTALMLAFVAVRMIWPAQIPKFIEFAESRKLWIPVCAILLAGYLVLVGLSTTYVGFSDHVEPNIVAVSSLVSRGAPLYHGLESAQRYALLYGPMSYLPFVWALRILGQQMLSVKLVVVLANVALFALLWRVYRTRLTRAQTTLATVAIIPFLLAGEPYLIEVRGDVLMIVAAALGLVGAIGALRWRAALLLAAGAGICVGVKITGGVYFVPLFVMLFNRRGLRSTAAAGLGAVLIACLPFSLPEVSVTNHFLWLREAGHHPLAWFELVRSAKALVTVSVPVLLLMWRLHERDRQAWQLYLRQERMFLLALLFSVGLTTVAASKTGAGEHHYLPFYPLLGYLCCDLYSRAQTVSGMGRSSLRAAISIICCIWLLTRVGTRVEWGWDLTGPHVLEGREMAVSVTSDLTEIMRKHPAEKIEMGYGQQLGKTNELTYFRPVLVFAGNPLTLDAPALADMELGKLAVPQSTIVYLQSCQTQIWLIPKGEHPFTLPSLYDNANSFPRRDIFGDALRAAFFAQYQKRESSAYFDLWSCGGKEPAA
jgi:hypothetical protein